MAMYETVIYRGVPWPGESFVSAGVTQSLQVTGTVRIPKPDLNNERAETAHMLDVGIFDGIAVSPVPDRQNIEQTGQNYGQN